ncbi:MAG: PQQ-binding-like beta-propeller repeat protein [bacterium]
MICHKAVLLILLFPLVTHAQNLNEDLWAAARKGDAEAVKALLTKGAEVNAKTRYGATALSFAADRGHVKVIEVLIENGADVNMKDSFYNSPAMGWAAYNGHTEAVKLMLARGATEGKDDVLMAGIESNNLEMVKAVLASGGVDAETMSSALANATKGGKAEIVAALKDAGATEATASAFKIERGLLQVYAGKYKNDDIGLEVTFTIDNGRLIGTVPGQPALTYVPVDNTNFKSVEFSGIQVAFNLVNNQANEFTLKQSERSFIFKRVKAEETTVHAPAAEAAKKETKVATATPVANKLKKPAAATSKHWPSFRGMNASGLADGHHPPTAWNAEKANNIKWKTAIPGMSHSSPVIWDQRVFITTAISSDTSSKLRVGLYGDVAPDKDISKHIWQVYCLNKMTGKVLWEKVAHEGVPKVRRHTKATQANSTPATDGKHLVALFGAEGLFCYDLEGTLLWSKGLGMLDSGWFYDPDYQWGHGSSPIIYKNLVIVQCDIQRNSFIAAYALKDGKEVWRTGRDEIPSWGTPTIYESKTRAELIANGTVTCYNAKTGEQIYRERLGGQGSGYAFTASPIAADDRIYFTSEDGEIFVVQAGPKYDLLATNSMGEVCMATPAISEGMVFVRTQGNVYGIGE